MWHIIVDDRVAASAQVTVEVGPDSVRIGSQMVPYRFIPDEPILKDQAVLFRVMVNGAAPPAFKLELESVLAAKKLHRDMCAARVGMLRSMSGIAMDCIQTAMETTHSTVHAASNGVVRSWYGESEDPLKVTKIGNNKLVAAHANNDRFTTYDLNGIRSWYVERSKEDADYTLLPILSSGRYMTACGTDHTNSGVMAIAEKTVALYDPRMQDMRRIRLQKRQKGSAIPAPFTKYKVASMTECGIDVIHGEQVTSYSVAPVLQGLNKEAQLGTSEELVYLVACSYSMCENFIMVFSDGCIYVVHLGGNTSNPAMVRLPGAHGMGEPNSAVIYTIDARLIIMVCDGSNMWRYEMDVVDVQASNYRAAPKPAMHRLRVVRIAPNTSDPYCPTLAMRNSDGSVAYDNIYPQDYTPKKWRGPDAQDDLDADQEAA